MSSSCVVPYLGTSIAGVCGQYFFMSFLDQYIRNHTDVSGLCERVLPIHTPTPIYDYIVIGGGSGGATAAGRLAHYKAGKILLIEAGSDEPPATQVPSMFPVFLKVPDIDWGYRSEPQKHACLRNSDKRCNAPRGKVLGGCSVIHGMMHMKALPADFQKWVDDGNKDWSYENVNKFYHKIERNMEVGTVADEGFHGTEGPLTISRFPYYPPFADDLLACAKSLNYTISKDLNGLIKTGFAIAQTTNINGTRLSASKAFVWPQRNNKNLHIMLNTTATKIIFDKNFAIRNKKAIGVEIVHNGKTSFVKARKEVILSAGTFNSPHVLMLSGVGKREYLKSLGIAPLINLPGVGENFHNHVSVTLSFALTKLNNTNDLTWDAIGQYFTNHTGPMSATGLSQVTARLNSKYARPDGSWPDTQFYFNGFRASCGSTGNENDTDTNYPYKTIDMIPVALHTKSRGQVLLKSRNPEDPPIINSNDLEHPDDRAILIDGIRVAQKLAKGKMLVEKYGIEFIKPDYGPCDKNFVYDTDEFWGCVVQYATSPENHQMGTCKMGPRTDPMAVVNQKLLVHGTTNLRVLDASVIPTTVSANTAATIMMIAERGVHFIMEGHQ